jgi:hypothetical protein
MSAERGWIGDPQPEKQWHDSHYSREADSIAARSRPAPLNPMQQPVQAGSLPPHTLVIRAHAEAVPVVIPRAHRSRRQGVYRPWVTQVKN